MNYRKRIQSMLQASSLEQGYVTETFDYVGRKGLPLHPNTFMKVLDKTPIDGTFIDSIVDSMDTGIAFAVASNQPHLKIEYARNKVVAQTYSF